jgi:protein AroM
MVLTPHEGQVGPQAVRWSGRGVRPIVRFASPYAGADFAALGREARAAGAAAILLDCMGYTLATKRLVSEASGLPALLVRSLAARVAAEMLSAHVVT